jgi:hypothetical protein
VNLPLPLPTEQLAISCPVALAAALPVARLAAGFQTAHAAPPARAAADARQGAVPALAQVVRGVAAEVDAAAAAVEPHFVAFLRIAT